MDYNNNLRPPQLGGPQPYQYHHHHTPSKKPSPEDGRHYVPQSLASSKISADTFYEILRFESQGRLVCLPKLGEAYEICKRDNTGVFSSSYTHLLFTLNSCGKSLNQETITEIQELLNKVSIQTGSKTHKEMIEKIKEGLKKLKEQGLRENDKFNVCEKLAGLTKFILLEKMYDWFAHLSNTEQQQIYEILIDLVKKEGYDVAQFSQPQHPSPQQREIEPAEPLHSPHPQPIISASVNLIENIPAEAFLSSQVNPNSFRQLLQDWNAASDRKAGHYFVRRSTDGKEWRLCVYNPGGPLPIMIEIKEAANQRFQIVAKSKTIDLTGFFPDLMKKVKDEFNIELTKPIPPSLDITPMRNLTEGEIPKSQLDLVDEPVIGDRTYRANEFLSQIREFKSVSLEDGRIENRVIYKRVEYTSLASNQVDISQRCMISVGCALDREMILLDPKSSSLNKHYKAFVWSLQNLGVSPLTMREIAPALISYIRKKVFPFSVGPNAVPQLITLINRFRDDNPLDFVQLKTGEKVPVISIDYFINGYVGVCRHHSVVAAYLLDRLVKEHGGTLVPKGITQQIRDNIGDKGSHTWISFTEQNGTKWHIDTAWELTANLTDSQDSKAIEMYYGKDVIENEIKKTNFALRLLNKKP